MTSDSLLPIIMAVLGAGIIIGLTIHNWFLIREVCNLRRRVAELELKVAAWVSFYEESDHE